MLDEEVAGQIHHVKNQLHQTITFLIVTVDEHEVMVLTKKQFNANFIIN